jgi:hypothetical protein
MKRDDILRMAEQAGMERCKCEPRCHLHTGGMGSLTYFAKLIAAAEREAIKWNSIHSCHADCQNPACVIVREAVAAEREACANVAAWILKMPENDVSAAIRARGQE